MGSCPCLPSPMTLFYPFLKVTLPLCLTLVERSWPSLPRRQFPRLGQKKARAWVRPSRSAPAAALSVPVSLGRGSLIPVEGKTAKENFERGSWTLLRLAQAVGRKEGDMPWPAPLIGRAGFGQAFGPGPSLTGRLPACPGKGRGLSQGRRSGKAQF